ncbi:hypothetical protein J6590_107230 [Homalodisca vitripennis]|nr:hypothetical protein J6590_107230 [Homalodisca vitripennis]
MSRPPSLLPESITTGSFGSGDPLTYCQCQSGLLKKFAIHDVPRVTDFFEYSTRMDKDHDVFWASNSTEQDVQLVVGKTVSAKVESDKIHCLTLTLVTGHSAWTSFISGMTSPDKIIITSAWLFSTDFQCYRFSSLFSQWNRKKYTELYQGCKQAGAPRRSCSDQVVGNNESRVAGGIFVMEFEDDFNIRPDAGDPAFQSQAPPDKGLR